MRYGLGIDAGGTYTDAVIVDFSTEHVVATAKALTTKEDLSCGVSNAIEQLPAALVTQVGLVSLSTTLATNAIVEGKGGNVGALLLGFDAHDTARIAHHPRRVVAGRTDITGEELVPLDEAALRRAIVELHEQEQVSAFAVSGMVSVKNPAHELRAKALVRELTGKPVVCGHELSMQLDTIKRTMTATLNARLLPIIAELLTHVRAVMDLRGIDAPLMVVRGDGTLMSEAMTRQRPVETILSGPAASVCGAQFLSGVRNGLVLDIGGTTSDIALLIDGHPIIATRGAAICEWSTNVRAVDIDTVGLGGDSAITLTPEWRLALGPRRAIPLCALAAEYPIVGEELRRLWALREKRSRLTQPAEFYRLLQEPRGVALSRSEAATMAALADGPRSRDQLAQVIGAVDASLVPVANLETLGFIQRATLTPTDLLHEQGCFTAWDAAAARLGVELFAHRVGVLPQAFTAFVLDTFAYRLTRHLLHRLIRYPATSASFPIGPDDRALEDMLVDHTNTHGLTLEARFEHPLVAIGAPSYALAGGAAARLGAELVLPEHAEVANAVGAITGTHTLIFEATITPGGKGYLVHAPSERREFTDLAEAKAWAQALLTGLLEEQIAQESASGFSFHTEVQITDRTGDSTQGAFFLESQARAIGIGKPAFQVVARSS